jgi:hypothetical protein
MLSEEDHAQKDEPLHEVFDADDDIDPPIQAIDCLKNAQ